jgi:2Fe-2S ferredoxin
MAEQVKIIFIEKGEKKEFQVPVGTTVLEAAHNNNINLEGACEGSLACSTCHVILEKKFYDMLDAPSEDEEDMLDLAFGLTPTSRLGCQIIMTKELDGLTLVVPDETRNVSLNK